MVLAQRETRPNPFEKGNHQQKPGFAFLKGPGWHGGSCLTVFFFLLLVAEARTLQDTPDLHRQTPGEVTLLPQLFRQAYNLCVPHQGSCILMFVLLTEVIFGVGVRVICFPFAFVLVWFLVFDAGD